MTIRICLAKTIPVLWFSALALAALTAASGPQAKRPPAKAAPAKAAAEPTTLAGMVRTYRTAPTPQHRAAIEQYAATHPKDAPLANLALGVAAYEIKDYGSAVVSLRKAQPKLAPLADYIAYYLAASRVESKDVDGIPATLRSVYAGEVASPLAGRAWILQARAARDDAAPDAVKVLKDRYKELPQPEGDLTMADCYQAAGDMAHAATLYQEIAAQYLTGDAAARAAAALSALQQSMGAAFPAPSAKVRLHHADRLLETRAFRQAHAEYQTLAAEIMGPERDLARLRMGEADYQDRGTASAYPYLRELELPQGEADAERLDYLVECTRHLTDDDEMKAALDRLAKNYPHSPWRLKALLSAGNRFLLVNRPDEFVPLYRAVYQDFPKAPESALAHWKVTFQAYLHDDPLAQPLLLEHVRSYPNHATAGAALYFLGRWYARSDDPGAARVCYQRLIGAYENHYYAMLAREQRVPEAPPEARIMDVLNSVALPISQPLTQTPSHATTLHIDRSRLLRSAGLGDIADLELRYGGRTDGQSALLGMEMAEAADAAHTAVHIMKGMAPEYLGLPIRDAPRKFWELLFPLPYRADLERSAREAGVDPYLLAGLIRQESEFDPQALSHANAYGLTQVLPVTGRQYARQAGVPKFTNRVLFQPQTNLKIGATILSDMLGHNDRKVEQTLASYNAGPARPVAWLTWFQFREPAEFVESIPFTETRDYVQAVMRNADMYRRLYQ